MGKSNYLYFIIFVLMILTGCSNQDSSSKLNGVSSPSASNTISSSTKTEINISSIKIQNKITSLYQDEIHKLVCEVLPSNASNKELVYHSSIPSIASISKDGEIRALLPGITTIKVSAKDGNHFDSFELEVKKKIIKVESVEINASKTELVEGESLQLEINVYPLNATNKKYILTSLTPEYLSVNENGIVKALNETPENKYGEVQVKTEDQEKIDTIQFKVKRKTVNVESIDLEILTNYVVVGDEIKYNINILPSSAEDKTYTLSTTTPDIISIDNNGVVTAIAEGEGNLTVTSNDGNKVDSFTIKVHESSSYSEIKELLDYALEIEKNSATGGVFIYDRTGVLEERTTIEWTVYEDSVQMNKIHNNEETFTRFYQNVDKLLKLEENQDSVTLESDSIGDDEWQYSQDEANDMTSLVDLSNARGLSQYAKMLLDDNSSFNMIVEENAVSNLKVSKEYYIDRYLYRVFKDCEYKSVSYLDEYNYMVLTGIFVFNIDNSFRGVNYELFKYDSKDYDINSHSLKDNAIPSSSETFISSVGYGQRVISDENKIYEEDYQVISFEIDNSNFINDNGENVIHVGETKFINIANVLPTKYLTPKYEVEIEDETIISLVNNSGLISIKGLKLGTTIVKVKTDNGVENSITIKVEFPTVERIMIDYFNPIIYEGDSFVLSASVTPIQALDTTYTMEISENDTNIATLAKNENGTYTFNALKSGSVTVIAYANENPDIRVEETINIKAVASSSSIKTKMCESNYYTSGTELMFNENGTGTLKLQGGGEYSFNWDVDSSLQITFTNIVTTKAPDRWYDFKGARGSYVTDNEASKINLVIYDLDYFENVSLQLSK